MPEAPPPVHRYLLIYVVAALLVVAGVLGGAYYLTYHPSHRQLTVTVYTNLTVATKGSAGNIPAGYFGINLRVEYPPAVAPGSALRGTPISYARWPGGQVGERLDALHGIVYGDQGTTTPAASNLSEFVAWCRSTGCRSILQLPLEIDNASYAAQEVGYVTRTLGFEPSYWELGNEPAGWTHFGIPWTMWNTLQNSSPTDVQYAEEVHGYIAAIRAVDASARFLGLGGFGEGAAGVPAWLQELASVDGANLSGYSLHVYPAGNASNVSASLGGFFGTLNSTSSIPYQLPAARTAIAAGCKACGNPPIFVDELGAAIEGGAYDGYMGSYPEVPYIATELIQGLRQNVTSTELFAYESSYPGSLVDPTTGNANPIAVLYDQFLPNLPSRILATSLTVAVPGLFTLASEDPSGGNLSVLVVNTNADAVELNWTTDLLRGAPSESIRWAANASAPLAYASTVPGILQVTVPPGGIWLWHDGPTLSGVGSGRAEAPRTERPTSEGGGLPDPGPGPQSGVLTATRVSVPLIPGTRRTRCRTMSRASLTCPAWILTMRSKGPVTASTSTTWGICRTRLRTSSKWPTSVSTRRYRVSMIGPRSEGALRS
jgi:hypothetical protein